MNHNNKGNIANEEMAHEKNSAESVLSNAGVAAPKSDKYVYVIDGLLPEMEAAVAYRRAGRREMHERKVVKCPHCGYPLTHVDKDVKVKLYRCPAKKSIQCQQYNICDNCHNETGIILEWLLGRVMDRKAASGQ